MRLSLFTYLYEQQTYARPYQFAYAYNQCNEYCGICGKSQSRHRHKETALASAKLQRHEKQHIGKKSCEGDDEDAVGVAARLA